MGAARPAVVGAFVLGGLALAVAAILFFGGTRLFAPTTRAVVFFEGSVAGLDIGAPVTFRGVRVGSVQHVALHLSTDGRARIPVTVELLPGQVILEGEEVRRGTGLERLVAAGLRAQLVMQSFVTGQLRIDLDFRPGTPATTVAADTGGLPQIPALPSDFERLRATLSEVPVQDLAQTAQRVLHSVERLAGKLEAELGPLLDSTRHGVDAATRTLETTEQAVVRLQVDVSRTVWSWTGSWPAPGSRSTTAATRWRGCWDRWTGWRGGRRRCWPRWTVWRRRARPSVATSRPTARDLAAGAASLRGFARAVERDPSALLRGGGAR